MSLVIFFPYFEVALRMIAGRTNLRRLGADNDMSAVSAFPDFDLALGENLLCLYIVQQRAVSFLVVLFDFTDQTEFCRQLREALSLSGLGKCMYISVHS